jgi:hypothetical protein
LYVSKESDLKELDFMTMDKITGRLNPENKQIIA